MYLHKDFSVFVYSAINTSFFFFDYISHRKSRLVLKFSSLQLTKKLNLVRWQEIRTKKSYTASKHGNLRINYGKYENFP